MPVYKKVDFIFIFNKNNNKEVCDIYTKFKLNNPSKPLSPIIDAYTLGIALVYILELKDTIGKVTYFFYIPYFSTLKSRPLLIKVNFLKLRNIGN